MERQIDRTQYWPSSARKIVLRNIYDASSYVGMSDSKDGTFQKKGSFNNSARIFISYVWPEDVFVVWNAAVHAHIHNKSGQTTLSVGEKNKTLLSEIDPTAIIQTYKGIRQKGIYGCVEMILIVGKEALVDFCRNVDAYLFPNVSTIPKGKECLYATPGGKLERISGTSVTDGATIRERERFERAKRDPDFRKRVFERWGNRCIICGTTEAKILEAAHKESVKSGGSDDPRNSFCLCANHHRMYDSAILDIDITSRKFVCHSEAAKQMPWYKQAQERDFRLYLPDGFDKEN